MLEIEIGGEVRQLRTVQHCLSAIRVRYEADCVFMTFNIDDDEL